MSNLTREELMRLLEKAEPSWMRFDKTPETVVPFGTEFSKQDWSNSAPQWTQDGYGIRGPQLIREQVELPTANTDFDVYSLPREDGAGAASSCPTCDLPDESYCPHSLCFSVNIDSSEADAGGLSGDIIELTSTGASNATGTIGFYVDWGTSEWVLYYEDEIRLALGGSITGAWHNVQILMRNSDPGVEANLIVDGVESGWTSVQSSASVRNLAFDAVWIGSIFPGSGAVSHRSIKCVNLIRGCNELFCDEPEIVYKSYNGEETLTGSTTISGSLPDFTAVLRVDDETETDAYAEFVFGAPYVLYCCKLNSIEVTVHVYGTCAQSDCADNDGNVFDCTFTKTWTAYEDGLDGLCGPLFSLDQTDFSCIGNTDSCDGTFGHKCCKDTLGHSTAQIFFTTTSLTEALSQLGFGLSFTFSLDYQCDSGSCGPSPADWVPATTPEGDITWDIQASPAGTYNFTKTDTCETDGEYTIDVTFVLT